jgi:hypothetical protein
MQPESEPLATEYAVKLKSDESEERFSKSSPE